MINLIIACGQCKWQNKWACKRFILRYACYCKIYGQDSISSEQKTIKGEVPSPKMASKDHQKTSQDCQHLQLLHCANNCENLKQDCNQGAQNISAKSSEEVIQL